MLNQKEKRITINAKLLYNDNRSCNMEKIIFYFLFHDGVKIIVTIREQKRW